jgi:N-acetyl-anhydromuramyl-L-alanine amidase AmpD
MRKEKFMQIQQALSPNFTKGRRGKKTIAIVDHITAGLYPGTLSWMRNPEAKASANYLVTRTGLILQMVSDEDTSWASGLVVHPNWPLYDGTNPNYYVINIEHEGFQDQGGEGNLTELQYQASLWLHKYLIDKHSLPITVDTIIGHYRIDSVNRPNCPGPMFPWKKLFADLQSKGVVEDMKLGIEIPEVLVDLEGGVVDNSVILNVDGKDTTYIPAIALRAVGMTVAWDAPTKTVKITK